MWLATRSADGATVGRGAGELHRADVAAGTRLLSTTKVWPGSSSWSRISRLTVSVPRQCEGHIGAAVDQRSARAIEGAKGCGEKGPSLHCRFLDYLNAERIDVGYSVQMAEPQSVQGYIDQTPSWPDGTITPSVPMTRMQWRIWGLATAGKFFEGLVVFMTGVALPLIVEDFGLTPAQKGLVGAATLAGIMVGAITLGGLADIYGRRRMFVIEMLVFVVFLVGLACSPNFGWMIFFLFGVGVALGCDYPPATS